MNGALIMKPCKVCKLSGVRITPARRTHNTEYVFCANPDCPISGVEIPTEIWEAGRYNIQVKREPRGSTYKQNVNVYLVGYYE